jgi:hypothetical protein
MRGARQRTISSYVRYLVHLQEDQVDMGSRRHRSGRFLNSNQVVIFVTNLRGFTTSQGMSLSVRQEE